MSEFYIRHDFDDAETTALSSAELLLDWAQSTAEQTPEEEVYRHKEGRKTVKFALDGRHYFLKFHAGVGWREIVKNLVNARVPVVSAINEYRAIRRLEGMGLETLSVAAFAVRGTNPASRRSMIVTDDLSHTVSLETFCAQWAKTPPPAVLRHRIIRKVAEIARCIHNQGINHRDFYLCHFHLDLGSLEGQDLRCHLIDLHRARRRLPFPDRWREKDLGALYFSSMDCGLKQRDILRFLRHYSDGDLRTGLNEQTELLWRVDKRARRLYTKIHGRRSATFGFLEKT